MRLIWEIFDTDHSRKLDKTEFKAFLRFIGVAPVNFERIFDRIDADKSNLIELDEFIKFYAELTDSTELEPVFKEYTDGKTMNVFKFLEFLNKSQFEEDYNLNDAVFLITTVKPETTISWKMKVKLESILKQQRRNQSRRPLKRRVGLFVLESKAIQVNSLQ